MGKAGKQFQFGQDAWDLDSVPNCEASHYDVVSMPLIASALVRPTVSIDAEEKCF